jgi:hypothetical protein
MNVLKNLTQAEINQGRTILAAPSNALDELFSISFEAKIGAGTHQVKLTEVAPKMTTPKNGDAPKKFYELIFKSTSGSGSIIDRLYTGRIPAFTDQLREQYDLQNTDGTLGDIIERMKSGVTIYVSEELYNGRTRYNVNYTPAPILQEVNTETEDDSLSPL